MELLRSIKGLKIFSQEEMRKLYDREREFEVRVQHLSPCLFNKEMERLAIDLCWKSSQIEGNTYSLIQTETLLKDLREAVGKTKEEAHMLLNHKRALDYILEAPDFFKPLTVGKIENIHSILVQNLDVTRNLRKHPVGITGTNYRPLDNEFQIREAMEFMVDSVNATKNTLEKALLVLLLISYIQPFEDGNKRTARIMANSVLLADKFCPLSFRTVDPEEYRLAMLVFYEINSLIPFKKLFSEQFAFSTANYF
jgi:Fic family protein